MTEELQQIKRDAVLRAAEAYDNLNNEMEELRRMLGDAKVAISSADVKIQQLELSLAEERNRAASMQAERDDAVIERSELLVLFHSMRTQLEAFTVPLPELPSQKKKKNGKHSATDDARDPHFYDPVFTKIKPADLEPEVLSESKASG